MSDSHFDALDWLGRGVDMTSLTPFSIESVKKYIKSPRIIAIQDDQKTHTVTAGGIEYVVPSIVSATNNAVSQSGYLEYRSGDEALRGFRSDSGVLNCLATVAADRSSYPLKKSLPSDYQFSFYYMTSQAYSTSLREYIDFIDDEMLLSAITELPQPFSNEPSVVTAYRGFFHEFGSHVITGTSYGGRCNISTWASNKYPEVNNNWRRDVTAYVRGINNRGDFESDVFEEPQYQVFQTIAQTLFFAIGGDERLSVSLTQGKYSYSNFEKWLGTVSSAPALLSLNVTEIWTLLRDSNNSKVRKSADSLQKAFETIVQENELVTTLVELENKSGIAEVGILTPSAIVGSGSPLPTFDPTTQCIIGLSETKVRVGTTKSMDESRAVRFYVVNDGSPIDLMVSCNSGNAQVTINETSYSTGGKEVATFYRVPLHSVERS